MTYDQAISFLRNCESRGHPELGMAITSIQDEHNLVLRRWKNYRNYAEDLWSVCCEGETKGRPCDLFHRDDYKRMKNWQRECVKVDAETTEQ
jgi:hypothetical protein